MTESGSHGQECGRCIFWFGGICRRYPPVVVPTPNDNQLPVIYAPMEWRPSVLASDWCGEFRRSV